MCGGPEHSRPVSKSYRMMLTEDGVRHSDSYLKPAVSWSDSISKGNQEQCTDANLLELAANNDLERFQKAVDGGGTDLDEPDKWYLRRIGSKKMAMEKRTPLMIAASYGSVEVIGYILGSGKVDVNKVCGEDEATALHCAAAGGSSHAAEIVKLLLANGANRNIADKYGRLPLQVISAPVHPPSTKSELEKLLEVPDWKQDTKVKQVTHSNGGLVSSEDEFVEARDGFVSMSSISSVCSSPDLYSPVFSPQYPSSPKAEGGEKTKDYPVDPSLPDIKNSIYTTDEFRMFSFKVRPCSRAYSHDWTECPFVHPGENARRRDPRRYHYSCVPCPDFRKGSCRRGDSCEYAHGVFECWLHPAQYRTRLCKDGTSCSRRVCFFAHTTEEMRPLYVSMGSAVPSPRSSSPLDAGSASPPLTSSSQSPVIVIPPFSPSNASGSGLNTPPLSPSASSLGGSWSQPSVPTLHLPGGVGLQASRLRAALSARDIPADAQDYEELSPLRQSIIGGGASTSTSRMHKLGLNIPATNLTDLFAAEVSPEHSLLSQQLHSQLQLQQLLSPLSSQFQTPPQSVFTSGSPEVLNARKTLVQRGERTWNQAGSLPSPSSWSDWGSPTGKPDWGVKEDLNKFRKSASFATEPDVSWVQTLVKDGPSENVTTGEVENMEDVYTGWNEQD